MKKLKKINGYLIVQFNAREKRDYEDLGTYGIIDAELYTGDIDLDKSQMEYFDADTLIVAIEQAQSLEAEEGIDDEAEDTLPHFNEEDELTAYICDEVCGRREELDQYCGLEDDERQKKLDELCEGCAIERLVATFKERLLSRQRLLAMIPPKEKFPADEFTTFKIVFQGGAFHGVFINDEEIIDVREFSIIAGPRIEPVYRCERLIPIPEKYWVGRPINEVPELK